MSHLALRPAVTADLVAAAALVNSAYRGDSSRAGWTTEADLLGGQRTAPQGLADVIARPGNAVLVHEDAQGLACTVHLERLPPSASGVRKAYLGMLTVRPTTQAGGLGRQLLAAAEAWAAQEWGVQSIEMTVIAQRAELIAWYERRGYARTGETRPFPYGDANFGLPRREDLYFVVLQKVLR
jgi:ribosomal protein S18 acetylase RimI-like enzyme